MSNYNSNMNQPSNNNEHIYFNVRIDNAIDGVDNSTSPNCIYNKQTQNILEKQSDYQLAVDHWTVRANLPIFIATIKQGTNTDINAMPFTVCYRYDGTDFASELTWVPDPFNADITKVPSPKSPADNNGIQDLITNPGYYWCTKYFKMVEIINASLKDCYDAFNAAHPGIHAKECWLQYDERTGLIGMVSEASYATGANKAEVYFDALLYKYIDGINSKFHGFNNSNGKDYQIDFKLKEGNFNAWAEGNHYASVVPNKQTLTPDFIIMNQEADARFLWSNIKGIEISSNSIGIRNTYMPFYKNPQQINNKGFSNFNQSKKSIISYVDYNYASPTSSPLSQSTLSRDIFYSPRIYRWNDLISNGPLNNIHLEVSIITEDGFTLPLNLPNKSSCEISLVFRKK